MESLRFPRGTRRLRRRGRYSGDERAAQSRHDEPEAWSRRPACLQEGWESIEIERAWVRGREPASWRATGRSARRSAPDADEPSPRPVRVSRWWPSPSHQHDRSDGERQQHHRPGQPGLEAALFERLIIPVVPGRPSVIHRPMVAHAASRPRRVGRGATLQGAAVPGRCLDGRASALLPRGEEHRDDRVLGQRRPPADQPRDAPDVAAGPCERLRVEARPEGSARANSASIDG